MKILIFLSSLELGGAERQALLLAEHLKTEDHIIQIWGLGKPGKITSLCEEKKIICRSKCYFLEGNNFQKIKCLLNLIHDIREFSPDIIIPFCTPISLQCALIWRFTKTHVCLWNERDIGIYHRLHKTYPFAMKLSTCIVTNSNEGKNYILRECGNDLDVRVINNGVYILPPKDTKEIWRKRLGANESTFIACMVANLHPIKNHSLLINAWNEALKSNFIPKDSLLVLAGREDMAEDLKRQVINYGIKDKIIFLGSVDDIPGLLSAVDLGVLSSFTESQPNAILEYMYSGLPIIASNLPSIKEILSDTDSIFFNNDSVEELVIAIKQMFSSDRRRKAGRINEEKCKRMYLPERMFNEYKNLFIELLNIERRKISLIVWFDIFLWFPKYFFIYLKSCVKKTIKLFIPHFILEIFYYRKKNVIII